MNCPCEEVQESCTPACLPECNCTSDDIKFKGAGDLCTGILYDERLTDVINKISTFAKTKLNNVAGSEAIKITSYPNNCGKFEKIDVILSQTPNNALSIEEDGLYAQIGEAPEFTLQTEDTATLDLTYAADILSGDVRVSASAGNSIVVNSDGIFVQPISTILANNGLTKSTNTIQLGGSLIKDTFLGTTGYKLQSGTAFAYRIQNDFTQVFVNIQNASGSIVPNGTTAIDESYPDFSGSTILNTPFLNVLAYYSLGTSVARIDTGRIGFGVPVIKAVGTPVPPELPYTSYVSSQRDTLTLKATDTNLIDLPSSKNDTYLNPQLNVLYTNAVGKICSAPYKQIITKAATLTFGSVSSFNSSKQTLSVPGVVIGDIVNITCTNYNSNSSLWTGYCSTNGIVTVQLTNFSGTSITPGSCDIRVAVTPYIAPETCTAISILSGAPITNANNGLYYYRELVLNGSNTITISEYNIPSWMEVGVKGNKIILGGIPMAVAGTATVSFRLTNMCSTIVVNQTISVLA